MTFTDGTHARNYLLGRDRYVKLCNRQSLAQLRAMYADALDSSGITVLVGGPMVMSKDELISALADHHYPDAPAARVAYYQSVAG